MEDLNNLKQFMSPETFKKFVSKIIEGKLKVTDLDALPEGIMNASYIKQICAKCGDFYTSPNSITTKAKVLDDCSKCR